MAKDEEYYNHATITRNGELVEGEEKPKDWAFHYYEVRDDGQWAKFTYRIEAKINPGLSFIEAQRAISTLRTSGQETDEKMLGFLEKMTREEKRFNMDSLFVVKGN